MEDHGERVPGRGAVTWTKPVTAAAEARRGEEEVGDEVRLGQGKLQHLCIVLALNISGSARDVVFVFKACVHTNTSICMPAYTYIHTHIHTYI